MDVELRDVSARRTADHRAAHRTSGEGRVMPAQRIVTRAFVLLTIAHFLQSLGWASMALLPIYLDHLHASRGEIGAIMSIAAVGGLLLRPATGWAIDRLGRKRVLFLGTAALVLGMCGLWLVTEISILVYALRVMLGIGMGATFTAYFTFASDIIPVERRTEGLALFGISGVLPLIVNPITGLFRVDPADLRLVFPVLGLLIASSLIPLSAVPEAKKRADAPRMTAGAAKEAVFQPRLFSVWVATVALSGMVSTFMAFATVTAGHRGVASPALIWVTYAGGAVTVRLLGSALLDRVGSKLVPISLLVFVGAFGITAAAGSFATFLLAALLAGIGHGLGFPVLASQIVGRVPEHLRGSGVAALTALWDMAALLVTPVFGMVADLWSDAALFYAGAGFAGACLLVWAPLEARVRLPRPSA
jgi:MFS family permease